MEKIPVYEGREPYIFVSYAHKDSEKVMPLVKSLYYDKYRVWYDEGIAPGSEWPHYIAVHLENCDTMAAFISENYAASVNCENEIVRALELGKNIIVCSLDGTELERLRDCPHADIGRGDRAFSGMLDYGLTGDGVTGYERTLEKGERFAVWEARMGMFLLVLILYIGLFGLVAGWFDEYLTDIKNPTSGATQEDSKEETVIESEMLTEAILLETGKGDLLQEVEFESKKAARSLASAIGNDGKIKYLDLRRDHREELELGYADDETLAILKYFPDLKTVQVHSGDITSLGELKDCSKLETVELTPGVFPVKYPKKARFEVTLMQ